MATSKILLAGALGVSSALAASQVMNSGGSDESNQNQGAGGVNPATIASEMRRAVQANTQGVADAVGNVSQGSGDTSFSISPSGATSAVDKTKGTVQDKAEQTTKNIKENVPDTGKAKDKVQETVDKGKDAVNDAKDKVDNATDINNPVEDFRKNLEDSADKWSGTAGQVIYDSTGGVVESVGEASFNAGADAVENAGLEGKADDHARAVQSTAENAFKEVEKTRARAEKATEDVQEQANKVVNDARKQAEELIGGFI